MEQIALQKTARRGNPAWVKGVSGNPKGGVRKPEIDILRHALDKDQQKHGNHLIEHALELARTDKNVLIAILKKILPDRLLGEGFDNKIFIQHITNMLNEAKNPTSRIA